MSSKNLASVWNNLKKIPELKKKIASNTALKDNTVLPFFVEIIKDIYNAYIQSDRNSWDYQIAYYNFHGLDKHEVKKDLIKQYNNCLYSYSDDKTNPWVIDEQNTRFIKIRRKYSLGNKEKLPIDIIQSLNKDLTKKSLPGAKLINPPTYWEKIEESLNKKTLFKFINAIWDAISSHANLLRWFSFLLILFAFPFPTFPLILVISVSIIGYLTFRFTSFTNKNKISTFPNLLEAVEEDKILDHIKQKVFNKAQYKKQLFILQKQLLHLDIKVEKLYKNLFLQPNKNSDTRIASDSLKIQFKNSSIYQKLNQVYPKTQLVASLVTKIMNVTAKGRGFI